MTTLKQEFIAGVAEMLECMPPHARSEVISAATVIARVCGESPEAWRGAVATATCVVGALVEGRGTRDEAIDTLNPNELKVMTVLSVLVSLPPGMHTMSDLVDHRDTEEMP